MPGGGHGDGGRLALHAVPSAAVGTGLANYTSATSTGTLTVGAKALNITADSIPGGSQDAFTKTYGTTLTFAGTGLTATGLANSDTVTSASLASSVRRPRLW